MRTSAEAAPRLGLWSAGAIVVANMVGTGVFSTLSYQVHALPDERAILWLWVIGGVSAIAGALCYAELGAARPRSGGEYALLTQLFHPALGFVCGWISILGGFAGPIAAAALAFAAYFGKLMPATAHASIWVAMAMVTAISLLHMLRVEIGARFQVLATLIKIGVMLGIVTAAIWLAPDSQVTRGATAELVASPAFAVSLVYVSYAYFGWNAALYVAGEVRAPQRNLPLALIGGTALVTLLYVLVNWAFLRLVPFDQLVRINPGEMSVENELAVGFLAGRALFGDSGGAIVGGLIAFTLISTVSAMVLAGPRVLATIAEDWRPFAVFAKRYGGAPRAAIAFQWLLTVILLATASFEFVIGFIGVSLTLFNMAVIVGFLRDRALNPMRHRPFRAPLGRTAALVFLSINGWMIVYLAINSPRAVLASLAAIALVFCAYWPLRRFAPKRLEG